MSPLDSAFLRLEDRHTSLHIASIAVFDGLAPSTSELAAVFAAKLPSLPRLRQRVCEVPLRLGQPVWVDDPTFSLAFHLRRTALPPPGSMIQLRDVVGRLMSQQLDRSKPLWECWIVDGLPRDRWALVNKVHHCMVDGIAGTDLLATLLEHSPRTPTPSAAADGWHPRPVPGPVRLLAAAIAATPRRALDRAQALAATSRHPRPLATALAIDLHGIAEFGRTLRVAPASSLSGALGASRVWMDASASLSDVKKIKSAFGGTVNDVVLAVVTRGFRDLILERGEIPPRRGIVTLVPATVRMDAADGQPGNQISAMLAALPVQIEDPRERFAAVRAELDRLKGSGEAQAGQLLTQAAGLVPPVVAAVGLSVGFRLPQRVVVTVATNVPGPREALFVAGRRLRELYPYVPIADHVRIAVAITSYDGRLYFGVTADRDSSSDISILAAGIEDGIQELIRAVDQAA